MHFTISRSKSKQLKVPPVRMYTPNAFRFIHLIDHWPLIYLCKLIFTERSNIKNLMICFTEFHFWINSMHIADKNLQFLCSLLVIYRYKDVFRVGLMCLMCQINRMSGEFIDVSNATLVDCYIFLRSFISLFDAHVSDW